MIDDDVHQRVKPTRLGRILDEYRQGGEASADAGFADAVAGGNS
jgi:hypothetical protein